jgi:tetratricopeptide (TPR) repeat protein
MLNKSILALIVAALPFALGCGLASRGQNISGVQAYQQGNYQVAMQRFQYAQQANPQDPNAYYNLAVNSHRTGMQSLDKVALAQAESLYNTCLQMNPNHVECRRALAVLLTETGRKDQAVTMLTGWATQNPTSADARIELARLSEELGDPRNAEIYLHEALRIDGNNWRAHSALGRQRELQGRYADALQNYQRAQAINPTDQLAQKLRELSTRVAQNSLPRNSSPVANPVVGGSAAANTSAGTNAPNGYNWTNPIQPNTIIANPPAPLGTRSATAPYRSLQY